MPSNPSFSQRDSVITSSSAECSPSTRIGSTNPTCVATYQNLLSKIPDSPSLSNHPPLIYLRPLSDPPVEVAPKPPSPCMRSVNDPPNVAPKPPLPFRRPMNDFSNEVAPKPSLPLMPELEQPVNDLVSESLPRPIVLPLISRKPKKQPRPNKSSRRRPQCFLSRRSLLLLNIFSFVINIAAVVLLFVMLIDQRKEANSPFSELSYDACLSCIALRQNTIDIDADSSFKYLQSDVQKGKQLCCGRTSRGFSALLDIMSRSLKDSSIDELQSTDHYKFSPVSAHVSFKEEPFENKVVNLNKTYKLKFNEVSPGDHSGRTHARQVELIDDHIRIVHTGRYYVYSSVYFRPATEELCRDLQYQTWGNFIVKIRENSPANSGVLVKTVHSCCFNCRNDHHSTFTGGVFNFLAGDHIYVESSGSGIIRFEDTASFFGLYILGSVVPGDTV
ncbi:hypothetical protein Btru_035601 [Bulinus truncatus]|nr:hypothetical protein Btru_035601 [Bulinus truncatus]